MPYIKKRTIFSALFATTLMASTAATSLAQENEEELILAIAGLLESCSYDGSPLKVDTDSLQFSNKNASGEAIVHNIMRYTGLPQNFTVVPGKVPNAAAVIVLDQNHLPHRVIAYNPDFMKQVHKATENNNWAPVSVLAHEIGHHLSGHTLTAGGSQPPIELEADKFSGFVLQKMGADLDDAKKAIETLVPDEDSPTHPAKRKRIAAIKEGWQQSCQLNGGKDCSAGSASEKPIEVASVSASATAKTTTAPIAPLEPRADLLPTPSKDAIPAKFDRFIIDEVGIYGKEMMESFSKRLYEHAQKHNVEVVVLVPESLDGKTADEYAYDMLRQMRVGKTETGNGAVLVTAPNENEVGVALGAGVYTEFKSYRDLLKKRLSSYLEGYKKAIQHDLNMASFYKGWEKNAFSAPDHILRDTRHWEWVIRYQSIDEAVAAKNAYDAERKATGERYDPKKSPVWRKIIRTEATLINKNPSLDDKELKINSVTAEHMQPLHFQTKDGKNVIIYINDNLEAQMPVPLQEGKRYSIVGRERTLNEHDNNYQLEGISYAQVGF